MDTPTHAIIGRLAARAIWPQKKDSGLVNLATICSIIPDLDVFIPGDALESLVTHRGFSHSIVGALIGAAVVAQIASKTKMKATSFTSLFCACFLGWAFHILFDVLTSYGTVVFAPFSNYRVSLDTLFIIDPYLDLIVIAGLCLGWKSRLGGRAYRGASYLLLAYVLLSAALTVKGIIDTKNWAEEKGIAVDHLVVMPTPFSPLHRRAMITSGSDVHCLSISLDKGIDKESTVFRAAIGHPKLEEIWKTRAGEIYKWFARVPIVEFDEGKIYIQDLQFMQRSHGLGWLGRKVARMMLARNPKAFERRMFMLEVNVKSDNQLGDIIFRK
ncbi:MAG: inner membrane protein [Planctomycetota bacterium]|jgi:inner membrane protein